MTQMSGGQTVTHSDGRTLAESHSDGRTLAKRICMEPFKFLQHVQADDGIDNAAMAYLQVFRFSGHLVAICLS